MAIRPRLVLVALAMLVAVGATPVASAAAGEAPMSAQDAAPAVVAIPADINDFSFESFHADYSLGRDDDGHSTLTTRETLVAVFPDIDQNRGIVRAIPKRYQGHPTDLHIVSVTDETGSPRSFESDDDDDSDMRVLTIRGSQYVHGKQTYVITYTQRYVTDYFGDTNDDEFYWDVNGDQWGQPFGRVSATITVATDLEASLTGSAACYYGYIGANDRCEISRDGAVFTAAVDNLSARQGMTIAIGFAPHTFVPRDDSVWGNWSPLVQLGALGAALVTLVISIVARVTRWRDDPGRGTVIPQYDPPQQDGFLVYANLLSGVATNKAVVATVLRLAVDGAIVILDDAEAERVTGRRLAGKFSALPVDRARARRGDDLAIYDAMFPGNIAVPFAFASNVAFGRALSALNASVRSRVLTLGYRRTIRDPLRRWLVAATAVVGVAGFGAGLFSFIAEVGRGWSVAMFVVSLAAAILALALLVSKRPLTRHGAENKEYLQGLRMFIDWAEKDRLAYLQSPEGAERRQSSTALGTADVLRIHEVLLPFAAFFGQEKRWVADLGNLYASAGTEPGWYHGSTAFSAAAFSSALSSVSSSLAQSFASSTSSSSGGSGGGGSSGGGGGGGGGGGA